MSVSVEQYANLNISLGQAQTTLSGNGGSITAGATSLNVAADTGFPTLAQFRILIDNELMIVTAGAGTTTWTVTRGAEGTTAASHNDGATVAHILTRDGLKGISGSIILSDIYANLPAAGTVGHLYLPADGVHLLRDTGAAWNPWGRLTPMTIPPLSSALTALNVTTATLSDSAGTLFLKAPNISVAHGQFWLKSLAAGAYTWIVHLETTLFFGTDSQCGLALRDTGTGKIISFEHQDANTTQIGLRVIQWTDANTRSNSALNMQIVGAAFPWMKIHDDGTTNRTYSVSRDGINWYDVLTESRTTWIGAAPNQAGIFATANGSDVSLGVYSWSGV